MVSPFRRKSKDEKSEIEDDLEIDEVVGAEVDEEEIIEEEKMDFDLEAALLESAKRVTHTCMDIRGESLMELCGHVRIVLLNIPWNGCGLSSTARRKAVLQ